MANLDGALIERIELLERQNTQLQLRVQALAAAAQNSGRRQVRLARAVDPGAGYPVSGNTFPIQFLDADYTEAAGDQAANYHDRTAAASRFVHAIDDAYVFEDSILEVFENRNQWFTKPGLLIRAGVVTETGGIGVGLTGTVTIYENTVATSTTVEAKLDWLHGGQGVSQNKQVVVVYFPNEKLWRILFAECEEAARGPLQFFEFVDPTITSSVSLPSGQESGSVFYYKNITSSTNNVTMSATGGESVENAGSGGAASTVLNIAWQGLVLTFDNVTDTWWQTARY